MEVAKPVKIKANIMWCFHNKINAMAEKYTVDLCNLSEPAVKGLEKIGLSVNNKADKPEKGDFIVCKSKRPIKVIDSEGNDLSDIAIGNGSVAVAIVSYYDWEGKYGKGRSPSLRRLVVDKLVAYEEPNDGEEDDGDVL